MNKAKGGFASYIESILQQSNIDYDYSKKGPDKHSFYFSGNFDEFSATFAITINEEDGYIFYFIKYPYEVLKDSINAVVEYITRINFGDVFGAFIFDYVDSTVAYHLATPLGNNMDENEQWFAEYLRHAQDVVEEFHEGLLEVLGGRDPYAVLKEMGAAVTKMV
ncbi:MAG: YbjN domain-containing protein [Gracilimonas sp.]